MARASERERDRPSQSRRSLGRHRAVLPSPSSFYLAPLLLILLSSLPVASAQSCRNTTCYGKGECLNANTTSLGCICDVNGDGYGLYCNETALQCALSRCSGRGVCVAHLQSACECGLTRYNGDTGCSTCIPGFSLASNCTNCTDGYFGDTCSVSASACGLTYCNARGLCLGNGSTITGCACFGTLFTNQSNCTSHPCGIGFPAVELGFSGCACPIGFLDTPAASPRCQRQCGAHGVPVDNLYCNCTDFYAGDNCDTPPIDCGLHGSPVSNTLCNCTGDYYGTNCENAPIDCGEHGTRVNGTLCLCDDLWGGTLCDQALPSCNGHGQALSPTLCECTDGWVGDLCDIAPLVLPESGLSPRDWGLVIGGAMASLLLFVAVIAYAMKTASPPETNEASNQPVQSEEQPLLKRRRKRDGQGDEKANPAAPAVRGSLL